MSEASKSPFYEQSRQMTIKLNEIHEGQWGDWDEIDRQTICAALESAYAQGRREGLREVRRKLDNLCDRYLTSSETDLKDFELWLAQQAQDEKGVGDARK